MQPTVKVLAIALMVVALVNFAGVLAPGFNPPPLEQVDETLPEANAEMAEDVGGLNSLTGIAVIALSVIMVVAGVGFLRGHDWYMAAIIPLGLDIILKGVNIVAQIINQEPIIDMLPAVVLILVEGALYTLFTRDRSRSRAGISRRETVRESMDA